jgi:hypothetical protein
MYGLPTARELAAESQRPVSENSICQLLPPKLATIDRLSRGRLIRSGMLTALFLLAWFLGAQTSPTADLWTPVSANWRPPHALKTTLSALREKAVIALLKSRARLDFRHGGVNLHCFDDLLVSRLAVTAHADVYLIITAGPCLNSATGNGGATFQFC